MNFKYLVIASVMLNVGATNSGKCVLIDYSSLNEYFRLNIASLFNNDSNEYFVFGCKDTTLSDLIEQGESKYEIEVKPLRCGASYHINSDSIDNTSKQLLKLASIFLINCNNIQIYRHDLNNSFEFDKSGFNGTERDYLSDMVNSNESLKEFFQCKTIEFEFANTCGVSNYVKYNSIIIKK